jgi:hypothetical protein
VHTISVPEATTPQYNDIHLRYSLHRVLLKQTSLNCRQIRSTVKVRKVCSLLITIRHNHSKHLLSDISEDYYLATKNFPE